MSLVFVDCEAFGGCPATGRLTEFGAVDFDSNTVFHGMILERGGPSIENPAVPRHVEISDVAYYRKSGDVFVQFDAWLHRTTKGQPVFVSDNPAFDWQWINDGFYRALGYNPFGHSARRIGDFYAGLVGDFRQTQKWKRLRVTKHDHHPVHDALGNVEAFRRLLNGER